MHVVYAPEDGDKREWDFKGHRILTSEAEALEKVTGISLAEFSPRLMSGSATAKRGLLWLLLRREEPSTRYSSVDFPIGDLTVEMDDEEKAGFRDTIMRAPGLSDDERRAAIAELGLAVDGDVEDEGPKETDD
jgi:hypothetical protein